MKFFYKLSGNVQSKPSRLIISVLFSFLVMTFVNGFIGGVGGFPVFLAFIIVFYLLRNVMGEGNRLTHQMAMTSRREILCGIFIVMVPFASCFFVFPCDRMGKYQWCECVRVFSQSDCRFHV